MCWVLHGFGRLLVNQLAGGAKLNSNHGFTNCDACRSLFNTHVQDGPFEVWGQGEPVRLTNNPASWGSSEPTYRLLGFSKGNTQNKAMSDVKAGRTAFEEVPFKGMRKRLYWLLCALGLVQEGAQVDSIFNASETRFQSSSLIRCSISAQDDNGNYSYKLKDILAADSKSGGRVREIMCRCAKQHLANATNGQSFILMGLDKDVIKCCKAIFTEVFGSLSTLNGTTYRTPHLSFVHVSHPSGSQTDPQYHRWCEGNSKVPKVIWAREEVSYRTKILNSQDRK